jgi:hypothetical protein
MVTDDAIVAALDKPRTIFSIMQIVAPGGSELGVHTQLLKMREAGRVKFSIATGKWQRVQAAPHAGAR